MAKRRVDIKGWHAPNSNRDGVGSACTLCAGPCGRTAAALALRALPHAKADRALDLKCRMAAEDKVEKKGNERRSARQTATIKAKGINKEAEKKMHREQRVLGEPGTSQRSGRQSCLTGRRRQPKPSHKHQTGGRVSRSGRGPVGA
jgi:hypothetical protein